MWGSLEWMKVEIRELVVRGDRSVAKGEEGANKPVFLRNEPDWNSREFGCNVREGKVFWLWP